MSRNGVNSDPSQKPAWGNRKIEIEPGVWIDYLEWEVAQKREKRWWDGYEMSEEDRQANLKRLNELYIEHFGVQRKDLRK